MIRVHKCSTPRSGIQPQNLHTTYHIFCHHVLQLLLCKLLFPLPWDLLHYSGSSCGAVYPNNLVYSTNLCSPSTCQGGFSVCSDCQETCSEPIRCQAFCVVPCQMSCYRPRTSTLCSPCWTTYPVSLGFGSSRCSSLSSGYRSCCGSRGFRPLGYGICDIPSLGCRSSYWNPINFPSRGFHSSCYWPICRYGFY
uniref:Keratin-associated protein n=1 Tax=Sus scrofa TaxID=9823 RepID=A0A4X1SK17_PIG